MTEQIESKVIGGLQNQEFDDWWLSNPIKIPFFGNNLMCFSFLDFRPENDIKFIEDADFALNEFLKKGDEERLSISHLVHQNCINFLEAVEYDEADRPLHEINENIEIWKFVYPRDIYVERYRQEIYISILCDCAWEQEHGLKLVYRQGRELTRVTDNGGLLIE